MADQEEKFPPRPQHGPCRPCSPWRPKFPYDVDYPGDHPHRPPTDPWYHCNDTEPLITVRPWESCCDSGDHDPCLCITSGEVEVWNQTYSAVSGHSGDWDRAVDDSWKTSADNWESSFETVSANSGFWDSAYKIASSWDSGATESIYALISATSAFITTYSASPYLNVDEAYFAGNGSPSDPVTLSEIYKTYWRWIDTAMNDLYSGGTWGNPEYRNWASNESYDHLMEWIQYHDKLMWKPAPDSTSPSGEPRSNVGGIFYQLEKLWHIVNEGPGEGSKAYEYLQANSAHFESTYEVVDESSGSWNDVYSAVSENSAAWAIGDDSWKNSASNWQSTYESVERASGTWDDTSEKVAANSAAWASGSHETWTYASGMDMSNYSQFNEPNTIYFNFSD